jgi:hypothetical protein
VAAAGNPPYAARPGRGSNDGHRPLSILDLFREFDARIRTSSLYARWAKANGNERISYERFADQVKAGQNPAPPALVTEFGRSLVLAGRMAIGELSQPSGLTFGISTGSGPDTVTNMDGATRARYFDECRRLGVTAVRIDDWGAEINVTVAKDARAKGLELLVNPNRDLTPSEYATFCTRSAQRFGPLGVKRFELRNEPNLGSTANPVTYAVQAGVGAKAIRQLIPDAVIVIGALAPFGVYPQENTNGINPVLYLERMLAALGTDTNWFDAVSHHPYGFFNQATAEQMLANPGGWPEIAAKNPSLVSTLARFGRPDAKIWVSEHGAPTDGGAYTDGVSEAEQARFAQQSVAAFRAASWAGELYWYSLLDRTGSDTNREGHFGLLRRDWSEKPGFGALRSAV